MNHSGSWEVPGSWGEIYQSVFVPAMMGEWPPQVIALTVPQPGEHVLDIACGTGEILESLGAEPATLHVRKKLRNDGIYGPHRETRANPAGLTKRQLQVLELLVRGMSDAEIADSLAISSKTAGHHVSAILSKLEVRTRHEAVSYAIKQKWISPQSP